MARRPVRAAVVLLTAAWLAAAVATSPPTNPPVAADKEIGAQWPVPAEVETILRASCFDCHSSSTRWPWYATVFPASLLLHRDVAAARGELNFSEWEDYNVLDRADLLDEACEHVRARTMPPRLYGLMHRDAALWGGQIEILCRWSQTEVERLVGGDE